MRLDLKIQDKFLKEMKRFSALVNRQGKFHFTKNEFFHNFCKDIAHIFESFLILQCLQRGILNTPLIFARTLPVFLSLS